MVINPESPTERKMIELSDENKSSLTEDVQLFLIEKPLVQFKLAIENKQELPVSINKDIELERQAKKDAQKDDDIIAVNEECKEQPDGIQNKSENAKPKRSRNIPDQDIEMTSSDDSNSDEELMIGEEQAYHKLKKKQTDHKNGSQDPTAEGELIQNESSGNQFLDFQKEKMLSSQNQAVEFNPIFDTDDQEDISDFIKQPLTKTSNAARKTAKQSLQKTNSKTH